MGPLDTVNDVVKAARIELQDTMEPYRYSDDELVSHLNMAMLEARRLRPDLFLGSMFTYTTLAAGNPFNFEPMYRPAVVYYVSGRAYLRDDENTTDARATVLLNKFTAQMLQIAS